MELDLNNIGSGKQRSITEISDLVEEKGDVVGNWVEDIFESQIPQSDISQWVIGFSHLKLT